LLKRLFVSVQILSWETKLFIVISWLFTLFDISTLTGRMSYNQSIFYYQVNGSYSFGNSSVLYFSIADEQLLSIYSYCSTVKPCNDKMRSAADLSRKSKIVNVMVNLQTDSYRKHSFNLTVILAESDLIWHLVFWPLKLYNNT
jgi:hypothetical protein